MQSDIVVIYEISFCKVSVVAIVYEDGIPFNRTPTVIKRLVPTNFD